MTFEEPLIAAFKLMKAATLALREGRSRSCPRCRCRFPLRECPCLVPFLGLGPSLFPVSVHHLILSCLLARCLLASCFNFASMALIQLRLNLK